MDWTRKGHTTDNILKDTHTQCLNHMYLYGGLVSDPDLN